MTALIDVTQADIDRANDRREELSGVSAAWCPIAFALRRQFPKGVRFSASPDCLEVVPERWNEGPMFYCRTTPTIQRWMRRWDRTWEAKPHRFRVKVR